MCLSISVEKRTRGASVDGLVTVVFAPLSKAEDIEAVAVSGSVAALRGFSTLYGARETDAPLGGAIVKSSSWWDEWRLRTPSLPGLGPSPDPDMIEVHEGDVLLQEWILSALRI